MDFPVSSEFIVGESQNTPSDDVGEDTECQTFFSCDSGLDECCSISDEPYFGPGIFENDNACLCDNEKDVVEGESSPISEYRESSGDESNLICESSEDENSSHFEAYEGGSNMNSYSSPYNGPKNQVPAFQPSQPPATSNSFPVLCPNQIPSPFRTNLFPVLFASPSLRSSSSSFSSPLHFFPSGGTTSSRVCCTSPAGGSFPAAFTTEAQMLRGHKPWNQKKCAQTGFVGTEYLKKLCKFSECLPHIYSFIFICVDFCLYLCLCLFRFRISSSISLT
jgi:hypothetical protein